MQCPNCGEGYTASEKFCGECGQRLPQAPPPMPPVSLPPLASNREEQKAVSSPTRKISSKAKLPQKWVFVCSIGIIVMCAMAGIVYIGWDFLMRADWVEGFVESWGIQIVETPTYLEPTLPATDIPVSIQPTTTTVPALSPVPPPTPTRDFDPAKFDAQSGSILVSARELLPTENEFFFDSWVYDPLVLADSPTFTNQDIADQYDDPAAYLQQLEDWGRILGEGDNYLNPDGCEGFAREVFVETVTYETQAGAQAAFEFIKSQTNDIQPIPSGLSENAYLVVLEAQSDCQPPDTLIGFRVHFQVYNVHGLVYSYFDSQMYNYTSEETYDMSPSFWIAEVIYNKILNYAP